jgi:hypothetical protein
MQAFACLAWRSAAGRRLLPQHWGVLMGSSRAAPERPNVMAPELVLLAVGLTLWMVGMFTAPSEENIRVILVDGI